MRTIQLCINCKKSPAGFWVSHSDAAVVRRPCCQALDRIHCDITPFGGSPAGSAGRAAMQ